jgi:hypothetical protein
MSESGRRALMSMVPAHGLQTHLWWTALLALVALGGAGLAVAADRQGNPVQRPELTWAADARARPWIDTLAEVLEQIHQRATDLSTAGRDVLGRLQTLDLDGTNDALAQGDQASAEIDALVADLRDRSAQANLQIARWRLGPGTTALLDGLDLAIAAAPDLSVDWAGAADTARAVADLVGALEAHDTLVFQATGAGRDGRWADALELLDRATTDGLATASARRDQLAQTTSVETLDVLLGRLRDYDDALAALYAHLRDGGRQSGRKFDALQAAVDAAQAALPADNGALSVIVGEAAGQPIAASLVAMDEVHGTINDALQSVADARATPAPSTPAP